MKKLTGNQSKLDLNKNSKLDAEDFKMLRSKKMAKGGGFEGNSLYLELSNIDHTRVIKWMNNQFDNERIDIKKSGSGYIIDTSKLSKTEVEDLMYYLKQQDYISKYAKGSTIEGDVVTYNDKKYKKQSNGKWLEISKHGLTKEEHSEKINEFAKKPNAHKEYGFHMSNRNKLSDKEYTEEQIGLSKDKKENGGELNETFPDTDAMSYAGGGGIEEKIMTDVYATKNGKHVKVNEKPMELREAEKWVKKQGIEKYYTNIDFKFISKYANGGSTSGWCYSIGGL